jgi:hypothetical protein
MSAAGALPRLFLRPAALWVLFPLAWALFVPVALLLESGVHVRALWTGGAPEAVRRSLWLLMLLVPAAFGVLAADARLAVQHARFAWTLPGARGALLGSTLAVAALPAAALALFMLHHTDATIAVAAFAVAFAAFHVPGWAFDAALPRAARILVAAGYAAAVFRPTPFLGAVEGAPLPAALMALALAGVLLRAQFSDAAARARLERWSSFAPANRAAYWATRGRSERRWTQDLATERLRPWLRAAAYEASGGRRLALGARHLAVASVAVVWGHVGADASIVMIVGAVALASGGVQLRSPQLQPLSRRARADIAAAGSLIDAASFCALAGAVLLVTNALPLPTLPFFADGGTADAQWRTALALTFAWAPIAQWRVVRTPGEWTPSLRIMLPLIAFATAAALSRRMLPDEPWLAAAAVGGLALAVHAACWLALRRHFARADLAPVRASAG